MELEGRRLSELVERRLTDMIRTGEVEEGEALPSERQLMELFGVGRPSVREALFALQRKGFVRLKKGSSPTVQRPSPVHLLNELSDVANELIERSNGAAHFEQARMFIETSIARHVAETVDEATLAALREALAANEAAIGKPAKFARTDAAFHRVLTGATGNPVLVAMHDAMVQWVIERRPPVPDPPVANATSFRGHLAVVEAIGRRDGTAAQEAMRSHLEDAARHYAVEH